jgi:hypothetical protein
MATVTTVTFKVLPDLNPDTSWLEGARLEAFNAGEFAFVGVRAEVQVRDWQAGTCTDVTSAGLWGIESDSGVEYLTEVGRDELASLTDELAARHIDISGIEPILE